MEKNTIRTQYAGFIIFAAQIISIITGLAFTLLLSRNMTQQEYGIWANIFDVVGYFLLLSGIFPFWTVRFAARRIQGAAKTGFLANLIISLIAAAIYISLAPTLTRTFNISQQYAGMYLIAAAQIIDLHLIAAFESILRAKKPQAIGYGLLIEEITKVTLAYVLIVRFQQLFLGALLSLIAAVTVQAFYYLTLTAEDLRQRIQWKYVREWFKGSTVNIYNAIGTQLAAVPIILLFLLGSQAARGNYQAATTFAAMIGYALFLSYALYPKLLAENSMRDVTNSLRTVLMFAILMTTIILSIPDSLLTILKVDYNQATPILLLLAADAFIVLITQFYTNVVLAAENLDSQATIPLRRLARSKIFKVFTFPYLQAAISIPASLYALSQYGSGQPVLAAVYVTAINLTAHSTTLLIQYATMHANVPIKIPWTSIGKYLLAAALTMVILRFLPDVTTLGLTIAEVAAGAGIYSVILLAIDPYARKIVNDIWKELANIFGKRGG